MFLFFKGFVMDFAKGSDGYESFCGTSYASKVLGISIGTVQGLVERNELRAWRTNGGHRRISLKSIQEYQHRHNLHPNALMLGEERLKIIVVEDDESTRLMLKTNFDRWGLPLDVMMYASAIEAMLDMPNLHPQVLLTDLVMPRVNGFDFVKTLHEHGSFKSMAVVAMTGLRPEQVKAKGGLPEGVQLLHKPIDLEWLRGYLGAIISVRQINQRLQAEKAAAST
jgi:excisionase family DNA binding protein